MLRSPPQAAGKSQYTATVGQRRRLRHNFDRLPRRQQSLYRAAPLVPGEHIRARRIHHTAVHDSHDPSPEPHALRSLIRSYPARGWFTHEDPGLRRARLAADAGQAVAGVAAVPMPMPLPMRAAAQQHISRATWTDAGRVVVPSRSQIDGSALAAGCRRRRRRGARLLRARSASRGVVEPASTAVLGRLSTPPPRRSRWSSTGDPRAPGTANSSNCPGGQGRFGSCFRLLHAVWPAPRSASAGGAG